MRDPGAKNFSQSLTTGTIFVNHPFMEFFKIEDLETRAAPSGWLELKRDAENILITRNVGTMIAILLEVCNNEYP